MSVLSSLALLVPAALFALFARVLLALIKGELAAKRLQSYGFKRPEYVDIIFGNAKEIASRPLSLQAEKWMKKLGTDVFFIRAAHVPMLIVAEGELAKQIMTKINVPKNQYKSIEKLVGKSSLLTSNPPDWTWKRKMINPAFHQTFLKNVVVSVAADTTLHVLNGEFTVAARSGDIVNLTEWISRITLDIIGLAGFGYDFQFSTHPDRSEGVSKIVLKCLEEPGRQLGNPLAKYLQPWNQWEYHQALKKFRKLGADIIAQAKEAEKNDNAGDSKTILGLLLKARGDEGKGLTDDELLDEVVTFLLAGHETTSGTLSFLLYMIAKHPEVKKKMYDEIDSVLGDRLVATYEDQTKLTYTSMVIKETLRLFPVGPGTARKPTTDLQIGKYFIPKDTSILVDFILLHRNPKYWDNPHEFKPERFDRDSGDNEDGKGKPDLNVYTYTPFSAGPRICIGKPFAELEMKILLAMFCKSFDFEIATDSAPDVPPHERFTTSITMRPMSYTVKLKKRS